MSNQDNKQEMIASIVAAYAARPDVSADDIAELTTKLLASLGGDGGQTPGSLSVSQSDSVPSTPAIAIEEAVTRNKVFCLCCGKGFKMLKRHIGAEHGLTEDAYRAKFGLADDFPLVAPDYSEMKANTAKKLGLGKYERKVSDAVSEVAP